MKNRLSIQFNVKKYSKLRKWEFSTTCVIFVLAIVALVATSWFSIDRAISDWFGRSFFNTRGVGNKLVRVWTTWFDEEAYTFPMVFECVLLFICFESWWVVFTKRRPNNWLAKRRHFVSGTEIAVSIIVLAILWYIQYGNYIGGKEFSKNFYIWTMAGSDITIPCYIISSIFMSVCQFVLTLYVHKVLAKREDLISARYWESSIFAAVSFALVHQLYINGLKSTFNRPYEVNLKWHDWTDKIKELYPNGNYFEQYNNNDIYWGYVTKDASGNWTSNKYQSFPLDMEFPWWKINADQSKLGVKVNPKDAFPSGHMNCSLLLCMSLFILFKNPRNKKEKVIATTFAVLSPLYVINMVLILECSWSHWLSDMSFSLITLPIIYILLWIAFESAIYGIAKALHSGK